MSFVFIQLSIIILIDQILNYTVVYRHKAPLKLVDQSGGRIINLVPVSGLLLVTFAGDLILVHYCVYLKLTQYYTSRDSSLGLRCLGPVESCSLAVIYC